MLAGVAIVLAVADRVAGNERTIDQLTWKHAISLGFWQALIPGVSRSGATISGGLFMGYRREVAARYAFLLAVPAVMASGLYKLKDIGDGATAAWGPTLLATVIAFGIGYVVIAWLLKYVASHTFDLRRLPARPRRRARRPARRRAPSPRRDRMPSASVRGRHP